jgi:Iap family predicted aminopeptidase
VVVLNNVRTKDDLQAYKGKLKNAVVLRQPPSKVAPVTDLSYLGPPAKKDGEPKKDGPKDGEPKKDGPRGGFGGMAFQAELTDFLKTEGAACVVLDSGKPHGLLVTTGGWRGDRAAAEEGIPRVYMTHEHYAMLWRLATRPNEVTRVEVEITNKFIPGPIVVYNTIGEVRGSEKPDEIVVLGAHLDSWELASGTTDNGTGSCVVLESARTIAALAKLGQAPRRTIRFCLFTGEEQGLHGSQKYVQKYKADLPKHSVALVHDTGTGKVLGFGTQGRTAIIPYLEPHLESLKTLEGWKGLNDDKQGGTDHLPFERAGVPGFACRQDMDEYRLTHHTQSDTFDKAKEPNLIQGAQVMAVTAVRIANLPEMLPRK